MMPRLRHDWTIFADEIGYTIFRRTELP